MFPFFWQQKVEFDPTSSYAVEGLKPDTLYKFRLGARSELGVGVYTPTVEARTAQSSKCPTLNTAEGKAQAVQFPSPGHGEARCLCPLWVCRDAGLQFAKGSNGESQLGFGSGLFGRVGAPKG